MPAFHALMWMPMALIVTTISGDTDGHCDITRPCPPGICCSKWGYCGTSPLHCTGTVDQDRPSVDGSRTSMTMPALSHVTSTIGNHKSAYRVFTGDGSLSQGWPSMEDWVSDFDVMWRDYEYILRGPCPNGSGPGNSDVENMNLKSAIEQVAKESGVDRRYIFAIMMQESKGCVRVVTTANGNRNPGLMQSHNGAGDCTNKNPCPAGDIRLMLLDGVRGTQWGNGLEQLLAMSGNDDSRYYKAAKKYNSGENVDLRDMAAPAATHCYVSDIANRLIGWSGDGSPCQLQGWL